MRVFPCITCLDPIKLWKKNTVLSHFSSSTNYFRSIPSDVVPSSKRIRSFLFIYLGPSIIYILIVTPQLLVFQRRQL